LRLDNLGQPAKTELTEVAKTKINEGLCHGI
jgi:hypothetical protein